MTIENNPITVILGADSLLGPRSGVGRMTLEIARVLRDTPAIADFGLLIQGRAKDKSWLEALDAPGANLPAPLPRSGLAKLKTLMGLYVPGVAQLHQAKQSWQMRKETTALRARIRSASPYPTVYHEPNMITWPYDGPTVPTFNDLSWHHDPAFHPKERIRWIERHLNKTIRSATRFIAISAFTRDEMVRELGIPADRVDVVHLAPSPEFQPVVVDDARGVLARYELTDQSYILSISTLEPRKNFDRLLAAYLALPETLRRQVPLVIAGGKGWGTVLHRPDAEQAVAAGQLRLLGHVPDSDLITLTARCGVFAYVSLYEGFGLPVIEAMATGVPVLASSTTATGETAGDAAILVDPMDDQAIQAGLTRLLEAPEERAHYAALSLQRASGFTWRKTVDRMADTWRQAAVQGQR